VNRLGWKGLAAAGTANKALAESEVAEGRLLCPLSSGFLFAPSSTREPVHRLPSEFTPDKKHDAPLPEKGIVLSNHLRIIHKIK